MIDQMNRNEVTLFKRFLVLAGYRSGLGMLSTTSQFIEDVEKLSKPQAETLHGLIKAMGENPDFNVEFSAEPEPAEPTPEPEPVKAEKETAPGKPVTKKPAAKKSATTKAKAGTKKNDK